MASSEVSKVSILGKESIIVGYNLIPYIAKTVSSTLPSSTYVLITDSHVGSFHLEAFKQVFSLELSVSSNPARFLSYIIPPGEQSKSRDGKAQIEDFLLDNACTRDTVVLALGGGVIGDLVGFVAATFMRGVRFVQIPTTLLSMVDSSVGGKTAIDTPHGKNLIGSFWQPEYVFIDAAFLGTLPSREFSNGMAEVIKTAAIWNENEFTFLEGHAEEILQAVKNIKPSQPNPTAAKLLIAMIVGSVSVKAHIVTIDERETGLRNLVNFGHSVGHAIEAIVTPSILHGECVSVGMILEAEIARQLGHLGQVAIGRLTRCLKAYSLPVSLTDSRFTSTPASKLITVDKLLDVMRIDKKNSGTSKKIVLLSRIGATVEPKATVVADNIIRKILSNGATVIPGTPKGHPVVMATPGSKSISNRALVLAALGQGVCRLKNLLHSDDTQVMMAALSELKGAKFTWEDNGETLVVEGGQGKLISPPAGREIYLGNAGTAARFLTTVCTLAKPELAQHTVITGNARMKQRPIGPLVDALRANGGVIEYRESQGCLPLTINHGLKGGIIQLEASVSSQYVSSILLCAPYAQSQVTLELTGGVVISQPYIDMTIAMMEGFGISVTRQTDGDGTPLNVYVIPQGTYKNPPNYVIESDASSATYPLAIAAITGSTCTVSNIGSKSLQGDARFAKEVLEPMGCKVKQTEYETTVTGPPIGTLKALGTVDMEPMTDAFLTASVLAAVATGSADSSRLTPEQPDDKATRILGIANQRVKECNRIRAMIDQLAKFGVETKELDDGLQIFGKDHRSLKDGASVYCYDDHRVAMAFSVLGSLIPNTIIEEKRCVEKTWPNWWDDLVNKIGLEVEGVEINHHGDSSGPRTAVPANATKVATQKEASFPSIILTGLRGSGKTYIGRLAARTLGWRFIDADHAFEERHGSLSVFVRIKGWEAFRAAETRLLEDLLASRPVNHVISLGGGIVETPTARDILRQYCQSGGPVVYLKRDLEEVVKYLGEEPNRPAYGESIREVCSRRIPWFEECSNYCFAIDDDIHTFFGKIVSRSLVPRPVVVPGTRSYFVSLTYPDITGATAHIDQITTGVDAVELRVDLLSSSGLQVAPNETNVPGETYVADQVGALRALTSLPIVYTVRTKKQGGAFPDDDFEAAFNLLKLGLRMRCEFLDVELTLPLDKIKEILRLKGPNTKIITSWHDWQGEMKWSASAMREKYNLASTYGDVIKLVGKANTIDDNFALRDFVRSVTSSTSKPLIAINIGDAGQLSRILNETLTPVSHSLLPTKAAPGQLSFADIQKGLSLIGQLPAKIFYLFGTPISHSMSPTIHNTGFDQLGLPHVYRLFETKEVDQDVEAAIRNPDFGGASVTIPHKLKIIPLLDGLSPDAKFIGAVNTVIPRVDPTTGARELYGDNTDWLAIRDTVASRLEQSITPETTALVIGAGGTSRAAIYALHDLGLGQIYLFNRTKSSAEAVVESFPSTYHITILDSLEKFPAASPTIIVSTVPASATTLSLEGAGLHLPPAIFSAPRGGVAVDMAYKPALTPLLSLASQTPHWKYIRGVEILIDQGCKQFQFWTGRRAPKSVITERVLRAYNG